MNTTTTTLTVRRATLKREQTALLDACLKAQQPLSEVLEELRLTPVTLANWLANRAFRKRVNGLVRQLRRARELQIQMAARNAAHMLAEISNGTAPNTNAVTRAACADLVRFARDRHAMPVSTQVDDPTPERSLFHPDVAPDEAARLARELSGARIADATSVRTT